MIENGIHTRKSESNEIGYQSGIEFHPIIHSGPTNMITKFMIFIKFFSSWTVTANSCLLELAHYELGKNVRDI